MNNNPVQRLQALRNQVKNLPADQKRDYHDAKKEIDEVLHSYGNIGQLAATEVLLSAAVKRGDG